jgi:hypothetical protein
MGASGLSVMKMVGLYELLSRTSLGKSAMLIPVGLNDNIALGHAARSSQIRSFGCMSASRTSD